MKRLIKKLVVLMGLSAAVCGILQSNQLEAEGLQKNQGESVDLILIIDQSRSMNEKDPFDQRDKTISFSKEFLEEYSSEHTNYRVGIVFFGTDVVLSLPLTPVNSIKIADLENLETIRDPRYTDFKSALKKAYEEFKKNNSINPQILLITDGTLIGSTEDFEKYQSSEFEIKKLRKRLITDIEDQVFESKKIGCQFNIITIGGDEIQEDKDLWENFAFSTKGMFFALNELPGAIELENRCQKIFSKILDLYNIQLYLPNSVQFEKEPLSINANFIHGKVVQDPSVILRVEISTPSKSVDSLKIRGNDDGFYISDYIPKAEKGIYSINLIMEDSGNILKALKKDIRIESRILGKKDEKEKNYLTLIFVILLASTYLTLAGFLWYRWYRNRIKSKSGDIDKYFVAELNRCVDDNNATWQKYKEIDQGIEEAERKSSAYICLVFRNFFLNKDEEGEKNIMNIMKEDLQKTSAHRKGIGFGIAFSLLLAILQAKNKYIFEIIYKYITMGLVEYKAKYDKQIAEIFIYSKEFFDTDIYKEIVDISKEVLEEKKEKGILVSVDKKELEEKKKIVQDIFDIYYHLLVDLDKTNIKSRLQYILDIMGRLDQEINFREFIIGIYESIYNSLEPKFWEGCLPFVLSKGISTQERSSSLPKYLFDIRDGLENINRSPFTVDDFMNSLKILKEICKKAFPPERALVSIIVEKWEREIEKSFYKVVGGERKFNEFFEADIQLNVLTKKIPINSPEYNLRYDKSRPIFFEIFNKKEGTAKNVIIEITIGSGKTKYIDIKEIDRLTILDGIRIYSFDLSKLKINKPKKIEMRFECYFDDIQKRKNKCEDRIPLEFFEIDEQFKEIDEFFIYSPPSREILHKLKDALHRNNKIINVGGQPGTGSISYLHNLENLIDSNFFFVYISFKPISEVSNFESFVDLIGKNVSISIISNIDNKKSSLTTIIKNNKGEFEINSDILTYYLNKKLVLILEDFGQFLKKIINDSTKIEIIKFLKMFVESTNKIILILAGIQCIEEMKNDPYLQYVYFNLLKHFDKQVDEVRIGLLNREKFEKEVLKDEILNNFNELALLEIFEVSHGSPYFINLISKRIIQSRNSERINYVTLPYARSIINKKISEKDFDKNNDIYMFWDNFSDDEKILLLSIYNRNLEEETVSYADIMFFLRGSYNLNDSDIKRIIKVLPYLISKNILYNKNGRYGLNIQILDRWIDEHKNELKDKLGR